MILGMTTMEFIGQIFGLIAVVISFVAYQMPTQKKILLMNNSFRLIFCLYLVLDKE